jgi:hypothetical protein
MTEYEWSGVWLPDVPLGPNDGARGNTVLEVMLNVSEEEIDRYEWKEEGKAYRLMVHPGLPAAMVPLLQGASNQLKKDLNSPLNRTTARASIVNVRDFALRYKLESHPPSPDRG